MNLFRIARLVTLFTMTVALPWSSQAAEHGKAAPEAATRRTAEKKIDINTADQATLETLPGIGPVTAQAIIAQRPFAAVKDLESVPSIGPAKMEQLKGQVMASHTSARVNLNTASRAELEALPEIGPVKAQAIIEARPFASVEDVKRVKGIKDQTFAAIKDKITVR